MRELDHCKICPRACGVNRNAGELGYCRSDAGFHIGSICLHRGEEPVISGKKGICNIFFSRCNLQCIYCQNYQISRNRGIIGGSRMTLAEIVKTVILYLEKGAEAVGFVTPSHFVPHVRAIIQALHAEGMHPVTVYNSNGYDSVESLKTLEGLIDVYLPDMKTLDPEVSEKYSGATDYPDVARKAIFEIFRQKGSSVIVSESGQALNGMIIRHLVLPGHANDSVAILKWIATELSPAVHISLMSQYYPTVCVADHPVLYRTITAVEYEQVVQAMKELGFYRGWVQESGSSHTYHPDFRNEHPFE
jgi:putative pyruvate formate lyase activating enzyme